MSAQQQVQQEQQVQKDQQVQEQPQRTSDERKIREELAVLAHLLGDKEFAASLATETPDYTALGRLAAKAPAAFRDQIVDNFKVQLGLGVTNPVEFKRAAAFVAENAVFEKPSYRWGLSALCELVDAPDDARIVLGAQDFTRVAKLRAANPMLAPTIRDLVLYALAEVRDASLDALVEAYTGIGRGRMEGHENSTPEKLKRLFAWKGLPAGEDSSSDESEPADAEDSPPEASASADSK